ELGTVVQAILQRAQFTDEARVTTMTDRSKVLAIELREKRIAIVQVRVVRAQARFEKLATFAYCLKPLPFRVGVAIISSQIAECLLAFKYGRRSNLLRMWPIAGDVGSISALWQTHFHRACRKPMCLRPNKCQLFQLYMLCRFTAAACYSRSHLASSDAQYVTMMSAPARLSAVMISMAAVCSSNRPFLA